MASYSNSIPTPYGSTITKDRKCIKKSGEKLRSSGTKITNKEKGGALATKKICSRYIA
jgi:hypothetical protein